MKDKNNIEDASGCVWTMNMNIGMHLGNERGEKSFISISGWEEDDSSL